MPGHRDICTHPDSTRWFLHRKMPQQRYIFHGQEDCTRERAGLQKARKRKGRSPLQTPAQFRNSNISMHQSKENFLASLTSSSSLHAIQGEVPGLGRQLQRLSAEARWRGGLPGEDLSLASSLSHILRKHFLTQQMGGSGLQMQQLLPGCPAASGSLFTFRCLGCKPNTRELCPSN